MENDQVKERIEVSKAESARLEQTAESAVRRGAKRTQRLRQVGGRRRNSPPGVRGAVPEEHDRARAAGRLQRA